MASDPSVNASRISSLPTWIGDARVWLSQMDAYFSANKVISPELQYSVLISSLPAALIREVTDIITSNPGTYSCAQLREELLKRTSVSQQDRVRQLLTSEELGDRKPSQLLRRMKSLLGANPIEDGILKQLFLSRLPHNIQLVLASAKDRDSVEDLAELADNIANLYAKAPTVASVSDNSKNSSAQPAISDAVAAILQQQTVAIQSLKHQIAQMQLQNSSTVSQRKFPRRSRSRSPSASRNSNSGISTDP